MKSMRPEVLFISADYIPENSLAVNAARVRFGSGAIGVVEVFCSLGESGSSEFDFRGLPPHLGNEDQWCIRIDPDYSADQNPILAIVEFAIGARQSLAPGMVAQYRDPSIDPTNPLYRYGRG